MIARQAAIMAAVSLLTDAKVAPAEQATALRMAADRNEANAANLTRVPTLSAGPELDTLINNLRGEAADLRTVAAQIEARARAEALTAEETKP